MAVGFQPFIFQGCNLLHQELPHDGLSWPLLVKEKRRFEPPEGDTEGAGRVEVSPRKTVPKKNG